MRLISLFWSPECTGLKKPAHSPPRQSDKSANSAPSPPSPYLYKKQRYGTIDQEEPHDGIHQPCVPGKQPLEYGAKCRPKQCKKEPDGRQQQRKPQQGQRPPMVKGEDIRLHRHDTVNIDLRVHKLQQEAGKESIPGVVFLDCAGITGNPAAKWRLSAAKTNAAGDVKKFRKNFLTFPKNYPQMKFSFPAPTSK